MMRAIAKSREAPMFRLLLAYVSVALGLILVAISGLISAGMWLETKDRGWLALNGRRIKWSVLEDFIEFGSLFACLGALLLFDGVRELRCRANRGA
jgi:hypothetical protein